jgi:DNA-binding NarL/FixJ family response regulator
MVSLPHPDPAPVRVLIVDDHPMVREGLRSMLEPAGVDIVGEAGTGADALRMAAALGPDAILLDLELPDLDGLVVLQRLKALQRCSAVLIITMHRRPGPGRARCRRRSLGLRPQGGRAPGAPFGA